mmetsp:Transcript_11759/g.33494  ORF Transcript_11759/g.33494 Transcript_11759/m.33494 type:complete len:392 (-) Transcript_11759:141-1316(-)
MGCVLSSSSDLPDVASRSSSFHSENFVAEKLGSGAFASVYAVSKAEDEEPRYAAKVMSLREDDRGEAKLTEQMVTRELQIMKKVAGTGSMFVVHLVESFREGHFVYIVMEKCDETLISALKSFRDITEEVYKPLVKGMLQGLVVIHNAGVVHRDLKPDNYMCCGQGEHRVVKLCDFGLAKIVTSPHRNDLCGINGTAPFMAPEMVKGLHYNAKVDLWSLGVILYLVLYGVFPYMPQVWTSEEMKLAIRLGTPAPTFVPMIRNAPVPALLGAISLPAAAFAAGLLQRRPRDRAGAEEALKHEWFAARALVPAPSLKSMLESAEFYGAFGQPREKEQEEQPSALDVKVAVLQVQHGHSSPWSRQTSAGSNYSAGPGVPIGELHSSTSLNADIP